MTYYIIPSTLEKGGKTIRQRQTHDFSGAASGDGVFSKWDIEDDGCNQYLDYYGSDTV